MADTIKRIARNSTVFMISQIGSYVLGFFYLISVTRYLGVEGFGILSFAISLCGILGICTDLGLNTLATREVARDISISNKFLNHVFTMKLGLSIITFLLIAVIINALGYSTKVIEVVYLIALSVLAGNLSGTIYCILRAHENIIYESMGQILSSTLMLIGAVLAIKINADVVYFAGTYAISSVFILIYSLVICSKCFGIPKIKFNIHFWKNIIFQALPFGLTGIFVTVYYWIDSVMLEVMKGNEIVGWYNAAYRLIIVLLFIPTTLNVVIFPLMVKYHTTSKEYFFYLFEKYFKYISMVGIPIGVGTTLLANQIILAIFGEGYQNSSIALQILVWSSVFIFSGGAFARVLECSNQQAIITKITCFCMIENIVLNLLTIPRYSYIGSSFATLVTELTACILGVVACSKIGYKLPNKIIEDLAKMIFASILMGTFVIYFESLNLIILIPLAAVFYFILLVVLNTFQKDDVEVLKDSISCSFFTSFNDKIKHASKR